jgi:hypothetical protein
MIIYRPIGHKELELICQAGLRAFPPRLPEQPIFYPVLNARYAREIAEGWNAKSDTYAGYITRFNIDDGYSQKFQRQIVGGKQHEELWIPAEELAELNSNVISHIDIIAAYFGDAFIGSPPDRGFANKLANADEYLQMLLDTFEYNSMDFRAAVVMNYRSVFCNYAYWKQRDINFLNAKNKSRVHLLIPAIADAWHSNFPGVKLPTETEILEHEREYII